MLRERVTAHGRPASKTPPARRQTDPDRAAAASDPAALNAPLRAGLLELGLIPSDQTQEQALTNKLIGYLALLVKWNRSYNLTAIRDPADMLTQHLLDSASIVKPLLDRIGQGAGAPAPHPRIIDVGSGAGLPGIVLALVCPQLELVLVEPVGKKAAFLRQVISELALTNVQVAVTHVETLAPSLRERPPDAIVCRAFASLADYATAVASLAGPQTLVAAMKGAMPEDEIAALPPGWRVREALPLQVPGLQAQRHLVLLAGPDTGADEPRPQHPAA